MKLTLHGGAFDGMELETPVPVDKVLFIGDDGRPHRYETDSSWNEGSEIDAGGSAVISPHPSDFDAEVRSALGNLWDRSI